MTVENATKIAQLDPLLPDPDDGAAEGDDHLRLIKQVLQNDAATKSDLNTFNAGAAAYAIEIEGDGGVALPGMAVRDLAQPADQRLQRIYNQAGDLIIAPADDADVVTAGTEYKMRRDGTATDDADVLCKRDGDRLYGGAGAMGLQVLWAGGVEADGTGGTASGIGNWTPSRTAPGVYRITIPSFNETCVISATCRGLPFVGLTITNVDNGGFTVTADAATDTQFYFHAFESFDG